MALENLLELKKEDPQSGLGGRCSCVIRRTRALRGAVRSQLEGVDGLKGLFQLFPRNEFYDVAFLDGKGLTRPGIPTFFCLAAYF